FCAGTKLMVSFWVANINNEQTNQDRFPNLTIEFCKDDANQTPITSISTGPVRRMNLVPGQNCTWDTGDWTRYEGVLELTEAASAIWFKIKNNCNQTTGNDFVMDDVEVRVCIPSTRLTIAGVTEIFSSINVCAGSTITLAADFDNSNNVFNDLNYAWYRGERATDADPIVWERLYFGGNGETADGLVQTDDNGATVTITEPQLASNPIFTRHYYRVVVAGNESNFESEYCRSVSNSFEIVVIRVPEIQSAPTAICEGGIIDLVLTSESPQGGSWSISGERPDDQDYWDDIDMDPDWTPTGQLNVTPTETTIDGALPGWVRIRYTTTPDYGSCYAEDSVPIYIYPNISLTPEINTICEGSDITLVATSDQTGSTFVWDDNSTSASRTVNPSVTTTYTVTVSNSHSYTDLDGVVHVFACTSDATKVVTVLPSVDISNMQGDGVTICKGTSVTLRASGVTGNGNIMYSWDGGTTYSATLDSLVVTPTVSPSTYTLWIKDIFTDVNGDVYECPQKFDFV
ncbi:MAG: hypothetical protein HUK15_04910, partial [Bacteroidales bacterium]|nr:hypothetical protein [Bacteroidales bacterium]